MKNFVLGILLCAAFTSVGLAQDCCQVCCCNMPAPVYCAAAMLQESTSAAPAAQEPVSVVEQSTVAPNAETTSVTEPMVVDPAPVAATSAGRATVGSFATRTFGGSNLMRRRGSIFGRLMGRLR